MAQKMIESMFDDEPEETELEVVDQEDDGEFGLVVNIDDIPEITKVMKQEQKLVLEKKRDYVRNMIDNKKVKQATHAIESMDTIMEFLGNREKMLVILESAKTPMDLKFIAEAYEKIGKQLQSLTRLDTVDGSGTSARAALAIRFGNNSGSTTTVQVGLQVDSE
jgi:hypothetical protein